MPINVSVNGVAISDQKVIAVYEDNYTKAPAVLAESLGLLKSQVLEIRARLREGLEADVKAHIKSLKALAKPEKITAVKPKRVGFKKNPSAMDVLSVLASSKVRLTFKDILTLVNTDNRKAITTSLKGLREKDLVHYVKPSFYYISKKGIKHITCRRPSDIVSQEAIKRAESREEPQGENSYACGDCGAKEGQLHSDDCPKLKRAANKLNESLARRSVAIDDHLADIDTIFEKQAIRKLETQVELLNKIHALTGKLAEEMKQSLAEVKTFIGV